MTENELKKIIAIYKKTLEVTANNGETCFRELDKDTLLFLKELEQYRAIGTIEEFKRAKEMEAVYGQVKWERDVAISQLEEIGVGLGQKMDEFKDLKEKSVAKKPDFTEDKQFALCPNISCNSKGLKDKQQYCDCCGQKLDWQ